MKSSLHVVMFVAIGCCLNLAHADRPPLNSKKTIEIVYVSAIWNKDPQKIDVGTLLVRDSESNRLVQIHLSETDINSATFSGTYALSWNAEKEFVPEIYVPDQNLVTTRSGLASIIRDIETRQLKRKPFILRRGGNNEQIVEIFDRVDDARDMLIGYREQQKLARLKNDPAAREAAHHEFERLKMEIAERQKIRGRINAFEKLPVSQQSAKHKQAKMLADEAMAHYQKGEYQPAEDLFHQSLVTDPTNKKFYYQYAVALYKNNKFNPSLVYLRLSQHAQGVNEAERQYYEGLNYFKLQETQNALQTFQAVETLKDKAVSPSAAFYEGVTQYQKAKYELAKRAFQTVLDTSNDAQLSKSADAYFDQIASQEAFLSEQSKKYLVSASVGLMYDSNVTLLSSGTSAQTSPSNIEGIRALASAGIEWRPVYERDHEWATLFNFSSFYTETRGLEFNPILQTADPTQYSLYESYRRKTTLFGKPYQLEVSPGFELVTMAVERTRDTAILNSYVLKLNNAFIMNPRWYFMPNFAVRRDQSLMTESVGDNNSTASNGTFDIANLFLLGSGKNRAVTTDLAYALNDALGVDYYYTQTSLAVGYSAPFYWRMTWNAKIAFYSMVYSELAPLTRIENDTTYSAGLVQPLNNWLNAGTTISYTDNSSNDFNHSYTKWTALITLMTSKWYF